MGRDRCMVSWLPNSVLRRIGFLKKSERQGIPADSESIRWGSVLFGAAMKLPAFVLPLGLALGLGFAISLRAAPAAPLPLTSPANAGFSVEGLARMHAALQREIEAGRQSGYISLVARDGRIVDWRAHGWQNVATKTPLRPDSIVRIYSMSKIVTSVAVLMLLEEGKLKLDEPVEKYLPALKDPQVYVSGPADAPVLEPAKQTVRLIDLLTHTAGYYYEEAWSSAPVLGAMLDRLKPWDAPDMEAFVATVARAPLHEQPRTRFRYGIATDLLGAVVEKVSGRRLDVFLAERIFQPLRLVDTAFWVPEEKRGRLAEVHTRGKDGRLEVMKLDPKIAVTASQGLISGGGGLFSTAGDYVRFAQMLLNGGQLDGVRLLSRKTVEHMTQNHIAHLAEPYPFGVRSQGWGLGVRVVTNPGASLTPGSVGAFGWDGAATTTVIMDPKERMVALLLCQHFPYNEDDILGRFANVLYAALAD